MSDEAFRQRLKAAQRTADGDVPGFADVWAKAEAQRNPVRVLAAVSAVIAVAAAAMLISTGGPVETVYVDLDELQASTSWEAPSDSLMPEHRFDIFHELPELFESTGDDDGALL